MMLFLLQQWLEALNPKQEVRTVSLDISLEFDSLACVWQRKPPSFLDIFNLLHSSSQHVAINGTLSSPHLVKAGVPHSSILGPVLFVIYINDLSNALDIPFFLFASDLIMYSTQA